MVAEGGGSGSDGRNANGQLHVGDHTSPSPSAQALVAGLEAPPGHSRVAVDAGLKGSKLGTGLFLVLGGHPVVREQTDPGDHGWARYGLGPDVPRAQERRRLQYQDPREDVARRHHRSRDKRRNDQPEGLAPRSPSASTWRFLCCENPQATRGPPAHFQLMPSRFVHPGESPGHRGLRASRERLRSPFCQPCTRRGPLVLRDHRLRLP